MRSFDGVLVGISAGTMNSAEVVYAQPELEGEATDPNYQRFLPGLGLTKKMILPHYQMLKDEVLDGLRVMEDIAYPDSQGRRFYLLVDGAICISKMAERKFLARPTCWRMGSCRRFPSWGNQSFSNALVCKNATKKRGQATWFTARSTERVKRTTRI